MHEKDYRRRITGEGLQAKDYRKSIAGKGLQKIDYRKITGKRLDKDYSRRLQEKDYWRRIT